MSTRISDYYQRHHASGDGRYGFTYGGESRSNWFAEQIRSIANRSGGRRLEILDLGCRDGTLTRRYAEGHSVRGVDIDPAAVERARALNGLDVRTHDLNRDPLPFEPGSFDVAVAGEVLEHLQFPDEVIPDVARVLRPGGWFLGSVPNAFRLKNRLLFLAGREFETDPTHLHSFSPEALLRLLAPHFGVDLEFLGGRRRDLMPRLMATQIHWVARKITQTM